MIDDEVPDAHHVLRYVKPSLIDGESVDGSAFVLRESESGLSVNWLERFEGGNCPDPVAAIRDLARMSLASTGRFARLNVGRTKEYVPADAAEAGVSVDLAVVQEPLSAEHGFDADPSHAEIRGLPDHGEDAAMVVGDLTSAPTGRRSVLCSASRQMPSSSTRTVPQPLGRGREADAPEDTVALRTDPARGAGGAA